MSDTVTAQGANAGLKNFIIGKLWIASKDGTRSGALRVSRDLPKDIVLTKGTTLFLNPNQKRDGKMDADYSVSVLLPVAVADELITLERQAVAARSSAVQVLA
jgi:hypothetical protein